jgi:hypothetical protein
MSLYPSVRLYGSQSGFKPSASRLGVRRFIAVPRNSLIFILYCIHIRNEDALTSVLQTFALFTFYFLKLLDNSFNSAIIHTPMGNSNIDYT